MSYSHDYTLHSVNQNAVRGLLYYTVDRLFVETTAFFNETENISAPTPVCVAQGEWAENSGQIGCAGWNGGRLVGR